METKITNDNFEEEVLRSSVPVLVDIYSESCVPCKLLHNILLDISSEYDNKVKFCTANMEDNSTLISEFTVYSVPTLLFFKDGNMVYKKNGLKTKESLIKDIEEMIV